MQYDITVVDNTVQLNLVKQTFEVSLPRVGGQGAQGPQGVAGPPGSTGPQGIQGAAGPQGPQGATGAQGPSGGRSILYGASDPIGSDGADGEFYINTTSHYLFGPKAAGTWPSGISLVGPQGIQGAAGPQGSQGATGAQGPQGVAGKTVLYGTSNPSVGVGVDGDFYINTSSNFIFGPKTSGTWPSGISLVGPQGATGAQGQQGVQGPAGSAGATGDQGIQGIAGPQGPQGATGATGAAGIDGKTVLSGTSNPTNGTGSDGDFYINTSANLIFGPKVAGTWPSGISLVGPQGPAGVAGNSFIQENLITLTENTTLTTGSNGSTTGPITIADGVTVTVPNGSTWLIL